METVKSIRDENRIVNDGLLDVKEKVLADNMTTVYECEHRRRGLCKAKIKVVQDNIVNYISEHTHAVDIARVGSIKVQNMLKREAIGSQQPASLIAENVGGSQ